MRRQRKVSRKNSTNYVLEFENDLKNTTKSGELTTDGSKDDNFKRGVDQCSALKWWKSSTAERGV